MMNPITEAAAQGRCWRVAAYIRLSRDDGNEESLSVVNQQKIIQEFLETRFPATFQLCGWFCDDGESGTDYHRPAFRRMLQGIETGQIDCVICKNLSRMFRNYADQGYFLETVFPKYGVRFLTVSEPRIDSFLHPELLDGLEIPISGLMNDRYAAKTSRDVRDTFAAKRRKGEFIGAFAPYGYRKSPEDKNTLLIDAHAAWVVRQIYHWFLREGLSKNAIARRLNGMDEPNPSLYKQRNGLHYQNPQSGRNDGLWSARSVSAILQNQTYTGTMVQGRQAVVSYKVHEKRSIPPEGWYIVPGTHEAVISAADFEKAQQIQHAGIRAPTGQRHLFAGLLLCADCRKRMTRQCSKQIAYYYCRTYRDKARCSRHSIREDALARAVLRVLRVQAALSEGMDAAVAAVQRTSRAQAVRLETLLREQRQALARVTQHSDALYMDWKNGDLSKADYLHLKSRFSEQAETLQAEISRLQAMLCEETARENAPGLDAFLKTRNIACLTHGLLTGLVQEIAVRADGTLEISLRFRNPCGTAGSSNESN